MTRDINLEGMVMNAAGTLDAKGASEVAGYYDALVTKTITMYPREGNPPPRLAETSCGTINSVGLENPGIDKFLEERLDQWDYGLPIIVSVFGGTNTPFEVKKMCSRLNWDPRVWGIEINLSCPNVEGFQGGHVGWIINECRKATTKPLFAKLSYRDCVREAVEARRWGADAVTLINTVPAMTYVEDTPLMGGLSGPAIHPIALRAVHDVAEIVNIPIIGCGGIYSPKQIKDFKRAGAMAYQVGSSSFTRHVEVIVGERTPG